MSLRPEQVNEIVDCVLNELRDRGGIGDMLDEIKEDDPEIWGNLVAGCRRAVVGAMETSLP